MSPKERTDDPLASIRRFARSVKDARPELDPFLCRHLRARNWSLEPSPDRDLPGVSTGAQYWCLRTMRPDGPDGVLALPEDCTDDRVCFEPAARRGADS